MNVGNGEPEAKITVPSVQVTACWKEHSALLSGLLSAKRIGRRPSPPDSTELRRARIMPSLKTPNVAVRPINAVGFTYSITSSRELNW